MKSTHCTDGKYLTMSKPFNPFAVVLLLIATTQIVFSTPYAHKTSQLSPNTPAPTRFVVDGLHILDRQTNQAMFFKGMGYSPYLAGETPLQGAAPADDGRYKQHLAQMQALGVNYLHLFPPMMPAGFFSALDTSTLVYGQDVWIFAYAQDFLDETYQKDTLASIKAVIDHTYKVGRPDRLVLFSIGDELQPESVARTDARHRDVHEYLGKHVRVTDRTPSEVAMARLIDAAMEYELSQYGRRHLYCHTSFTHLGPVANRLDLEVPYESVLTPDIGDLICLNIYTYARGVMTSKPGSVTGTTYQGYLEELASQSSKPIFITQVGLSTSPIAPKPWVHGFGGHQIKDVPAVFRSVWKDIHTAKGGEKFCGMAIFEFQDEWWKSGEDPIDSTRHEPQDPEEWFGVFTVEDGNKVAPKGKIADVVREIYR